MVQTLLLGSGVLLFSVITGVTTAWIIVNYDFFRTEEKRTLEKWKKLNINNIDVLICDEAHKLKNSKTNTYKNFKKIFTNKIFNDKEYRISSN